ncbi:MAG: single-stranded DNA-binding protein [Clostridioides difficile]|nr:single-stranded DNA-binding protein [Clostridioides difficile]
MNSLLKEAIDELKNIHCGEVFLLKELFKGYEWNRLEMNIRLKLGKLFLYEVVTNPNLNVEVINKSKVKTFNTKQSFYFNIYQYV